MKQQDFLQVTELYLRQNKDVCADIVNALAKVKSEEPYIMLNKLRVADKDINSRNEAARLVQWFIGNFTDWSSYYADVLYVAMKQNLDITPFFDLIDVEDLRLYTTQIISDHPDFAVVIRDYFFEHSYSDSIKGLYWSICLRERVVLFSEGMDAEQYISFFEQYALDVAAYGHRIYQADLFNEDKISVLPRAYRFGHYMQLAFAAKGNRDEAEYLKNLKTALHHYPVMKKPIETLSEYFEAQNNIYEQQNNEFAELANKVKAQIEQFLLEGQYEQAETVLAELAEMLPNDEDVKRYRIQLQAVQSPKEIGAKIQQ